MFPPGDNHSQIVQEQYHFSKTKYWSVKEVSIKYYGLVFCHSEAQPEPNDFHLKTFSVTGTLHSLFTTSLISEHWNLRENKSRLYWNHPDFNASPILETLAHHFHPNVEFQWLSRYFPEPKVRESFIIYFTLADPTDARCGSNTVYHN